MHSKLPHRAMTSECSKNQHNKLQRVDGEKHCSPRLDTMVFFSLILHYYYSNSLSVTLLVSLFQAFTWGTYHMARVAYDSAGNAATCSFNVYVVEELCPELDDPAGGVKRCWDWGPGGRFKVCKIECNPGLQFSVEVSTVPYNIYITVRLNVGKYLW